MATAILISPAPHDPLTKMTTSTRRAPLATISNATNSPHRILSTSGSKRPRSLANVSQQENEPPQKRQVTERNGTKLESTTPQRHIPVTIPEGKVFDQSNADVAPTAFQRKLVAARERQTNTRSGKTLDQATKDESIRQWQKHYRKIFPSFTFYFDGIQEETRARFVRHITALGAKEERFFSKTITHIITTRQIPAENEPSKSSDSSGASHLTLLDDQPQTINPSLLEKNSQTRNQSTVNIRRDTTTQHDILARGRQMGMKIWAAEKLQRILGSIFEDPRSIHPSRESAHLTRNHQEDLSQVLKNEKLGITSEREQANLPREMVIFKGPFIYVHDIDEKFRPTMVRDYPKVSRRQDGEWPQFRSAGVGKCPFVEDLAMKKDIEQEQAKQRQILQARQQIEAQQMPRTRSTVDTNDAKKEPIRKVSPRKALQEVRNPSAKTAITELNVLRSNTPSLKTEPQSIFPPMPERQTLEFVRPPPIHMTREPAASGIQRSNLTSAIQSQMISSTAATGVKAGTSREVHELKRKVLERTHTGSLSIGSIPSSHRTADLAGALKNARAPAPQRAAKSKAQEKLGGIQEDVDPLANDVGTAGEEKSTQTAGRRKKTPKRDPKPGYCENCRDKYDDFEEHISSRKHRKFAMTQSNWTDLDALLSKLQTN